MPLDRKFYELSVAERIATLIEEGAIDEADAALLRDPAALPVERADKLVENVVGTLALPLGIARNFRVNGRDVLVPMAIEEASVVAAASNGARLLRAGGGIEAVATDPLMIGQIQLLDVADPAAAREALLAAGPEVIAAANARHPRLCAAGGGARALEVRTLPETPAGPMLIAEIVVDVRDAMGANAINSMCEAIAPLLAARTGGRAGLRILSNLCDRRLVRASGRVPADALGGPEGVRGIVEASAFAEADPYRAATHNKGIMNGVDALLLATGQDWRAAEAAAHAYAARGGRYTALAIWRRDERGDLAGRLEMPLSVGVVGGGTEVHPVAAVARKIAGAGTARDLALTAAAVGLAQNLAAIRALAQEGIQRGHMALHRRARER
jgi:hydroxymethylglutaryl-CoA reductase